MGKLTADDTSIFMGLLNDLFPKTAEHVPRALDDTFEAKVSNHHYTSLLHLHSMLSERHTYPSSSYFDLVPELFFGMFCNFTQDRLVGVARDIKPHALQVRDTLKHRQLAP